MKFFKKLLLLVFTVPCLSVYAQVQKDSILQLPEVVIEVNRLQNFTTGNKIQKIDSATLQNFNSGSLADVLTQHSQVFIKSYGVGNLATISMRGAGTSQTAVLWNGFNIQGPTLGQVDFSLIPVTFLNDVQVQYGGAGALYGSGAIGGTIHLNSNGEFDKGISASVASKFGSFKNYYQAVNFTLSKKRLVSSFKFFNQSAKNDFPFINTYLPGNPEVRQQNSAIAQYSFLQENYFRINDNQQINLRIWFQDNDRQVPPIMSATGISSLRNSFLRLSSEWKKIGERATSYIRSAYFNERMNYKDPSSNLISNTHFQTSITEAESKIRIAKNQLLNLGINNTYYQAISQDNYKTQQNRNAFFASYKFQNSKNTWKALVNVREELINGRAMPFTPSVGFDGVISKGVNLKGNVSKNYRFPTLNDLYWVPGGNPNLKPESGWSEEIGLNFKSTRKTHASELNFTLYNSKINNWIIWLPLPANNNIWYPQNIQTVWSRGLESSVKVNKKINRINFQISALYNYVVSTNEKVKSANDLSYKKQLIYVPIYNAQGNISISYKNYYLSYVQTYTGNRFTTSDNTEYIKGYQLGNLVFSKNFLTNKFKINMNAKVNNLWNKAYQVIPWQAMPLRNFQLGISVFFNKPNN